jgi:alanine racemase
MGTGRLTIDLDAVQRNWRALAALAPGAEAGAVVKAGAYGLGLAPVATALARAGARSFFVAYAEEGAALRAALGPGPDIHVLTGHMEGDTETIRQARLIPALSSPDQVARHPEDLPFAVQLCTGMNRLGIREGDWTAVRAALPGTPALVMSHLACADEPDHPMNADQLAAFRRMTDGAGWRRSLAATGGILLGRDYHFDITRPGIGLYGGAPFAAAAPVVTLSLPVVQVRSISAGETVGYAAAWTAARPTRIATVAAGYADGLIRALSGRATLWHGMSPCTAVGRISMDLITVDITDLPDTPGALDILCPAQGIDALAGQAGTIGYEILTALGARYTRSYRQAS